MCFMSVEEQIATTKTNRLERGGVRAHGWDEEGVSKATKSQLQRLSQSVFRNYRTREVTVAHHPAMLSSSVPSPHNPQDLAYSKHLLNTLCLPLPCTPAL